jgi:hypothetical protein
VGLLSLVEVDDSFGMCVAYAAAFAGKPRSYRSSRSNIGASGAAIRLAREEALEPYDNPANALANRLPLAPAARSITL